MGLQNAEPAQSSIWAIIIGRVQNLVVEVASYLFCYHIHIEEVEFGNPMAQQLLPTSYPPQYVSLGRVSISKPSIWVTKPTIVSSPSFSTSAPLRYASFCCSSSVTSSVESNLPSSAKIFVKGDVFSLYLYFLSLKSSIQQLALQFRSFSFVEKLNTIAL